MYFISYIEDEIYFADKSGKNWLTLEMRNHMVLVKDEIHSLGKLGGFCLISEEEEITGTGKTVMYGRHYKAKIGGLFLRWNIGIY